MQVALVAAVGRGPRENRFGHGPPVRLRRGQHGGWSFGLQRYGQEWRDGRKAFQSQFNAGAVKKYRSAFTTETHNFLRRLCNGPEEWMHHLHLYVGYYHCVSRHAD